MYPIKYWVEDLRDYEKKGIDWRTTNKNLYGVLKRSSEDAKKLHSFKTH